MEQLTGKFTQNPNELMQILMSKSANSSVKAVLACIARKTYGFHKSTDKISLTQFESETGFSRPTVVAALERLQLVKLVLLVGEKGKSKKSPNEYQLDLRDWKQKLVKLTELVKSVELVKFSDKNTPQLVKPALHTKERFTKENRNNTPLVNSQEEEKKSSPYSPEEQHRHLSLLSQASDEDRLKTRKEGYGR